jgi:hypothetical protein
MNIWRVMKGVIILLMGLGLLWFATDIWIKYHAEDALVWTYEETIAFNEGVSYASWGVGAFLTSLGLFVIYLGKKELYVSDRGKLTKETLN